MHRVVHRKWKIQFTAISEVPQRSFGCYSNWEQALWHENTSCCNLHNVIPSDVGDEQPGKNQIVNSFPSVPPQLAVQDLESCISFRGYHIPDCPLEPLQQVAFILSSTNCCSLQGSLLVEATY